jgi:hypothetical protein
VSKEQGTLLQLHGTAHLDYGVHDSGVDQLKLQAKLNSKKSTVDALILRARRTF